MDRNTLIGFSLIGLLLVGMFWINSRSKTAYDQEKKRITDSTLAAVAAKRDTVAEQRAKLLQDSAKNAQANQAFQQQAAAEQTVTMDNNLVTVSFSTNGARIKAVALKNFRRYDSSQVVLGAASYGRFSYSINAGPNQVAESDKLSFVPGSVQTNADGSKSISFTAGDSAGGRQLVHQYTLHPGSYMIDLNISTKGAGLFTGDKLNLQWKTEAPQLEKDHKYELTQTHIVYKKDGEYDFKYVGDEDGSKSFNDATDWAGVQQQFFVQLISSKSKFTGGEVKWNTPKDSSAFILQSDIRFSAPVNNGVVNLQFYYGPSDYKILKAEGNDLEQIVPLGSGIFSFVKYINRYILLPVFDFFKDNIASMGIVILLLTLFIRLLTSPILYKSYLSGAKMKVLKPEVDALRAKHTKNGVFDQQTFSMEQMKLWREAGVSPFGGCIPALLQIPIFMSLYYFFQSNIGIRGHSFLWAPDLATYDSIAKLPFEIPFYGDHVSLFTLTAVATSLLISLYSMSNMQDQNNPLMKYMPYIFPVLLLGVFNRLPAALTWYYTVSNIITLILQYTIQNYVINNDKIHAQIQENRKKPQKKSRFAMQMEAMQEQKKKMDEMKAKR